MVDVGLAHEARADAALPEVLVGLQQAPRGADRGDGLADAAELLADVALELAQQPLEVERQAALAVIERDAELALPPELARDQRRVGEARVAHGEVLEAVRQRVADRNEAVARLAGGGPQLNPDVERRILDGAARLVRDVDVGRGPRISSAPLPYAPTVTG